MACPCSNFHDSLATAGPRCFGRGRFRWSFGEAHVSALDTMAKAQVLACSDGGTMSISGAVAELNKEITQRNKEIERLTQIRDSLLQGASESTTRAHAATTPTAPAKKSAPVKKPGPKKSAAAKKSVPAKASTPVAKREVSAATR